MEGSSSSSHLLSKRDKQIEQFLVQAMKEASQQLQQPQPQQPQQPQQLQQPQQQHTTAAEGPSSKKRRVLNFALEKLMQESILLAHRYNPILKEHLAAEEQIKTAEGYAKVMLPQTSVANMSLMYKNAIDAWLDDANDKISFATTNTLLAGHLRLKDCWILHYFSFLCCYRCEADNMFSLSLTGCSTTGKTVLFENPIVGNSHSFVGETGVSRYRVGNKSLLLYSDIGLERLMRGSDGEKFKTISRSEKTVCKIHSSTEELPPVFVFLTSNQNIHKHVFASISNSNTNNEKDEDAKKYAPLFFKSKTYPSTLDLMYTQPAKIRVMEPLVSAIKNRVLEAFVRGQTPNLVLPTTSKFERIHAILGLYARILNLLCHYEPTSFYSSALVTYVLTGLIDHASLWKDTFDCNTSNATTSTIYQQLEHLINKYFVHDEKNVFLERLAAVATAAASV